MPFLNDLTDLNCTYCKGFVMKCEKVNQQLEDYAFTPFIYCFCSHYYRSKAIDRAEPGRRIFQPGHLTWRALVQRRHCPCGSGHCPCPTLVHWHPVSATAQTMFFFCRAPTLSRESEFNRDDDADGRKKHCANGRNRGRTWKGLGAGQNNALYARPARHTRARGMNCKRFIKNRPAVFSDAFNPRRRFYKSRAWMN